MKIQSYYYTIIMLSKSHVTKVTTTKQAVAQLNSGQYESALALFEELAANDYKDSKKLFPFYFINFRITGGAPGEDLHGNVLATKTSVIK